MKALCWFDDEDIRVREVPRPSIINPRDAIVKVRLTSICGSDLHLYGGFVPSMKRGDIIGHELVGNVVETGGRVNNLFPGDRVVVPFTISCGECYFCKKEMYSLCDNSNPNALMAERAYGFSRAGILGYSHIFGGYAGTQAEYVRVPFADKGLLKLPDHVSDEQALFLSDAFPTGFMAAENCGIEPGHVIAVWGCGPVGLFALKSARLLGAEKVIGIDRFPERLQLARRFAGAEVINYEDTDVEEALMDITGGRGPDACIDAVGMEAHGKGIGAAVDRLKQGLNLVTDRSAALRQAIHACRKGGVISIPGVYGGGADMLPMGAVFNKGITIRTGQTNVQKYMRRLLEYIERKEVDPSMLITHRMSLDEGPKAYEIFRQKADGCVKVVLQPS